jgi:hypothetical protein
MATLKIKNANGQWEVAETPAAVKYTEQNLTDAQKVQARANIGASSYTTHIGTELIYSMTENGAYYMSCPSNFNVGDLYINTDENRVYRCTQGSTRREDVDFEVYYSYWTPAEFGVIEEYNNVDRGNFNWSQFLGEPRFVKMNFVYNGEFNILNESLQSIGKPRTLYLNLSTTTTDSGKNLNIQTIYNNKVCSGIWYFKSDNTTLMSCTVLTVAAEPYTKGDIDMKVNTINQSINKIAPLVVDIIYNADGTYTSSKTSTEIYNHVKAGGTAVACMDGEYYNLGTVDSSFASFWWITDDHFINHIYISGTAAVYEEVLSCYDVAYKSELPKAIPTSTIDALLS